MKKKTVCAAIACTLAVSLLSGCGGKTTEKAEKVRLMIGLPGGDGVTAMQVINNFTETYKDKYEVELDTSSWEDFTKKIKLQLAGKVDVTPVFITDSGNATAFGAQGALEDLTTRANKDLDKSLYSAALTAVTDPQGHLWGVPHALNSIAIVYNKDVFDEKGVAYPTENWTWQDMFDIAQKLTFDRNGDGETDVYGLYYATNITMGWWPFMSSFGTSPYKDDFRNSNLDDPLVEQAMAKYQEGYQKGFVIGDDQIAAYGSMTAYFADPENKLAMALFQSSRLAQINAFNPDLNYDVQIMPIGWNGERTCIYVPNVWVMYSGADAPVKDGAWELMKFYLNEESQMINAKDCPSGYPVMKQALDAVSANGVKPEHKDAFYRGIDDHGVTILENPCFSMANTIINAMALQMKNGEDVKTVLQERHAELQQELNYYYDSL